MTVLSVQVSLEDKKSLFFLVLNAVQEGVVLIDVGGS